MSLINIADSIATSYTASKEVKERTKLHKDYSDVMKNVELVKQLLHSVESVTIDTLHQQIWDGLFDVQERPLSGLAYLPTDILKAMVDKPLIEEKRDFGEQYLIWEQAGYLQFTPYILHKDSMVLFVYGPFDFLRFKDGFFYRSTDSTNNSEISNGFNDLTFIIKADRFGNYFKSSVTGAMLCLQAALSELCMTVEGCRVAKENLGILFEFVKSCLYAYNCNYSFGIDKIFEKFTFTSVHTTNFPYAIKNRFGNICMRFAIADSKIQMFSDSEFATLELPTCQSSDYLAVERQFYLEDNRYLCKLIDLTLHMLGIHLRISDVCQPDGARVSLPDSRIKLSFSSLTELFEETVQEGM